MLMSTGDVSSVKIVFILLLSFVHSFGFLLKNCSILLIFDDKVLLTKGMHISGMKRPSWFHCTNNMRPLKHIT